MESDVALRVFEGTRKEMEHLTAGFLTLKQTRVEVQLFDVDYWNHNSGGIKTSAQRHFGFSQSRLDKTDWNHHVILLSGLPRLQCISTCAHELMHLWINENLAKDRALDPDTTEALCELMAWKLMAERQQPREQERIRQNQYTRGKLDALLKIDQSYGLRTILDWVRHGSSSHLEEEQLHPQRDLPAQIWHRQSVPKVVPQTLQLKGLSGSGKSRCALINDKLFSIGDEKTMELKGNNLRVRCAAIGKNTVVLQIDGNTNAISLTLGP